MSYQSKSDISSHEGKDHGSRLNITNKTMQDSIFNPERSQKAKKDFMGIDLNELPSFRGPNPVAGAPDKSIPSS